MNILWLILTMSYLLAMNESTNIHDTWMNLSQNVSEKRKSQETIYSTIPFL